jgi:FixJ family two-component response regulator
MDPQTIMVIDDDADTRVFLFELLRSDGYKVVTYENPYEALTFVHQVKPAMIILDVRMPQVNGVEFLPTLRTAAPTTPVLILTAYGTLEIFLEARDKGATEMMSKPVRSQPFLRKVREILAGSPSKA